jgi:hypothetical protein
MAWHPAVTPTMKDFACNIAVPVKRLLSAPVEAFLAEPHLATLTTLRQDGSPM